MPHFFSIATGRLITVQARVARKATFPTAHAVKIKGRSEEALYPREFSDSLVFTSDKGEAIHYQRWRETHFNKAAVAVGLDGVQPHDLRRTYAALSIQAGVGPKALQTAMGHSDIRLTMDIYASLFEEGRDDHASRLLDAAEEAFSKNVRKMYPCSRKTSQKRGAASEIRTGGPTHYECVWTMRRIKDWLRFE